MSGRSRRSDLADQRTSRELRAQPSSRDGNRAPAVAEFVVGSRAGRLDKVGHELGDASLDSGVIVRDGRIVRIELRQAHGEDGHRFALGALLVPHAEIA